MLIYHSEALTVAQCKVNCSQFEHFGLQHFLRTPVAPVMYPSPIFLSAEGMKRSEVETCLVTFYTDMQRCRKHFECGGCISTFFPIFWQFQKVGVYCVIKIGAVTKFGDKISLVTRYGA